MDMQAEIEQSDLELTDDEGQLEQIQEVLSGLNEEDGDELIADVYRRYRFDLCCGCYHQIKSNPLGAPELPKVGFSQN